MLPFIDNCPLGTGRERQLVRMVKRSLRSVFQAPQDPEIAELSPTDAAHGYGLIMRRSISASKDNSCICACLREGYFALLFEINKIFY
ncbi:hypothetical protein TNIN_319171 [Trichonephila inaurata madagascariensis]|uniref:Uncharacterized protein n=1 Tax=Trichonephila inaurata madagascariensis TaxID=2747483 RepID=A0A8X6XN20_9ARAC|nr:hypothetical protein TNIN_319171 [Trichonephila inaurata madagascariensis]